MIMSFSQMIVGVQLPLFLRMMDLEKLIAIFKMNTAIAIFIIGLMNPSIHYCVDVFKVRKCMKNRLLTKNLKHKGNNSLQKREKRKSNKK